MYILGRSDIVWLDFEPSSGREITKRRPAFIISREAFHRSTGFTIVAPITSTKRGNRLEVELERVNTQGSVLVYQMKSLDFEARELKLIERALPTTTTKIVQLARLLVSS